jgi:hypothetical protein
MERVPSVIGTDDKEIESIGGDNDCWIIQIGGPVTKIVGYVEDGGEVWFAIYHGDKIMLRQNARYVAWVMYQGLV